VILVGVCGGVAAYKSCELVRLLVRAGHEVQVVQTPAARRFVGPTTFAALSRRPVLVDDGPETYAHLDASREAALLCIAPLTATTLARLSHGDASTVLSAGALAFTGPVIVAPAMNVRMWEAATTRANMRALAERGVEVVGPDAGELAEGEIGPGRMAEPEVIAAAIERRLAAARRLDGVRVLVTAGGTREPIDAVRYVGNRSSGRMGVALAHEAMLRGADVTLVLAAASEPPPARARVRRAETAADLARETLEAAARADVVVMAAAVGDYRPREAVAGKRAKAAEPWLLELEPTTDVLAELGRRRRDGQLLVGFAAEHGDGAVARGREKLRRKRADLVVVNDVGRADIGFDATSNEVTIVGAHAEVHVPRRSKAECAAAIWDAVEALREGGDPWNRPTAGTV
jgi:phosphopantothenoylcysteine decarboxylase/phosphopantothenate--cysteine ligase